MRVAKFTASLLTVVLSGCVDGATTVSPTAPARTSQAPSVAVTESPEYVAASSGNQYYFTELSDLVATSPLIVAGSVERTERGRRLGVETSNGGSSGGSLRARSAILTIEQVFRGSLQPGDQIVMDEKGYDRAGNPFMLDDLPWSEVGDRGVYFLLRDSDWPEGHYTSVHPDGRLLLDGLDVISFADTRLGAQLDKLTPGALVNAIGMSVADVNIDNIRPQTPFTREDPLDVIRDSHPREDVSSLGEPGPTLPAESTDSADREAFSNQWCVARAARSVAVSCPLCRPSPKLRRGSGSRW